MAYPATHNFNYYRGDTYEFKIYPKTNTGAAFDITDFVPAFRIATVRGAAVNTQVTAYAVNMGTYIQCAITPDLTLPTNTSLVYDVEIRKSQPNPYSLVYTLLTGTMTITDQITNISVDAPTIASGVPTSVLAKNATKTSMVLDWEAPTTVSGGIAEKYTVRYALTSAPTTYLDINGAVGTKTVEINATSTQFTFTGLTAGTSYTFYVASSNAATTSLTYVNDAESTLPEVPGTVTDFAVSGTTNSTIGISWSAPSAGGQTGYVLYLDGEVIDSASESASEYTFLGLTSNTSYTVGIAAVNTGGVGQITTQTVSTSV